MIPQLSLAPNRRLFSGALILALGAWLVVFGWTIAHLCNSPWTGIRTDLRGASGVVREVDPGSPADQAGLRAGDILLEVQGENVPWEAFGGDRDQCPNWEAVDRFDSGQSRLAKLVRRDQPLGLKINRDGRPIQISFVPGEMSVWTALSRVLATNLMAIFWLGTALLIARRCRSIQTVAFLAGATGVALLATTMALSMERELSSPQWSLVWSQRSNLLFCVATSLVTLWFGMVFPVKPPWFLGILRRVWLFPLVGLAVVFGQFFRIPPGPVYLSYGFGLVGNLGYVMTLMITFRRTVQLVHKRQIQWIFVGCALGTLPYALLTEIPLVLGWPAQSQVLTSLASVAIPLTIGLAILRWRLLDVSGLLDEGLFRLIAFAVLLAVEFCLLNFVSVVWAGSNFLPVAQAATLLVALLLWNRIRRQVLRRVRGSRLGLEDLPAFIGRLIQGEAFPKALGDFLAEVYLSRVFLRVGPRYALFPSEEPGASWMREHLDEVRDLLGRSGTPMLGFELAGNVFQEIPPDVENCLFLLLRSRDGSDTVLGIGPRWSPGSWTKFDVDRVKALISVAVPLGEAAAAWHVEEDQKRAILEQARLDLEAKVAERTKDFESANERLRQALVAREDFLAQMSHELRSPLAAVLGCVETVMEGVDGPPTPAMVRRLEVAERNGRHLLALIQDILDFTRGRAGKLPIHRLPCRIRGVLEQALDLIGPQLSDTGGRVEIRGQDCTESVVLADSLRVRQILTNLVSNALRHGAGLVEVVVGEDGADVVVEVMDRGAGVSEEMLGRLFKPFERFEHGRDQHASTGLGLALSRQLAHGMGGDLIYRPREGGGAVFQLRLPKAEQEAFEEATVPVREMPSVVTGRSVLVVDDHPDLLALCVSYFDALGWKTVGASCAEEALSLMLETRFDALLTDLGLPGMDGSELVAHLRKMPGGERLAIMVLTGAALPEDEVRCKQAGTDLFRVKPVLLAEVASRLALAVDDRRSLTPADTAGGQPIHPVEDVFVGV